MDREILVVLCKDRAQKELGFFMESRVSYPRRVEAETTGTFSPKYPIMSHGSDEQYTLFQRKLFNEKLIIILIG